ncbi:MAG TPA: MFS transporter [Burkholderiaceae bacterium]|nr:MFS transporter [Burkholderiaceae bacterium]
MTHPAAQSRETPYAWMRLFASLTLMTLGGSGMYAITVMLPAIQEEFAVSRSMASLPYTVTMVAFGLGGIFMGRIADRFGVMTPILIGTLALVLGYTLSGLAPGIWSFTLAHGLIVGMLGTAATFAPLVADTGLWFDRRRGIALAICMSGNYLAGAVWPPIVQHFMQAEGWRGTYLGMGVFCLVAMLPLALFYRRRPQNLPAAAVVPKQGKQAPHLREIAASNPERPLGMSPAALQGLLSLAGVACCVAMAMPQVHIVALCGDMGYGLARGAEMLALMLGLGIVSRLLSGWISDHIGGLRTLWLGSLLQGVALILFLNSSGLASLYFISGLFGLFQGGIVPSYALIVREYFAPQEAGTRVGTVLMATLLGMALGGWMAGALYDLTGSYDAAFMNGIAWNGLNLFIVSMLLFRARRALVKGLPSRTASAP